MARRTTSIAVAYTPTATADAANLVDATYSNLLQGGSSTQEIRVWEIFISGQGGSSAPTPMLLSRDSTVATGTNTMGSGQTDAPDDPASAALAAPAVVGNSNATTKPQRSATLHLLVCGLNAFGGNFLWRANKVEECKSVLGNTASLGEMSLSCTTGGTPGPISTHFSYEPL